MITQSSLIIAAALVPIAVSTICAVIINRRRANRAAKVGTSEFFREVDRIREEVFSTEINYAMVGSAKRKHLEWDEMDSDHFEAVQLGVTLEDSDESNYGEYNRKQPQLPEYKNLSEGEAI